MEKFCLIASWHLWDTPYTFQQQYTCSSPLVSVLTDGAHQEDAGVVPAEAAACMAILRFLWVLFVAIFENRFDTYSADPLDYWACKLSFGKYSVLVVMDRNFLEKLHFCLPFPLYSRHVGGRRQIKWDLKLDWIPAHYRSVQ